MVSFFVIQVLLVIPNWCDHKPAVCFCLLPVSCTQAVISTQMSSVALCAGKGKRPRKDFPPLFGSVWSHSIVFGAQCEQWLWTVCGVLLL